MKLFWSASQIESSEGGHAKALPPTPLIEPGLLPALRMMLGLQLLVNLAGGVVVSLLRRQLPPIFILFSLSALLLLLLYLSWERLQRLIGHFYLPVALTWAMFLPLVDRLLFIRAWLERNQQPLTEEMLSGVGWRGVVMLLIPLVFVAWQYDFRHVLFFTAAVIVSDFALLSIFLGFNTPLRLSVFGLVLGEGIAFLVVGYIVSRMMQAQRQQRRDLAEANRHLSHYAATIEQLATSRERNRLARELHDTLAHTLSAISVQLEAVDTAWDEAPGEARVLLTKSLAQTRSGLMETRRSLQALRASPLEDLGLALAICTLVESTAVRTGAALELEIPEQIENLPPDVEQGLYRIAQEALNNVTKHAEARHLKVSLAQKEGCVLLKIVDDGQGFNPAKVGAGGGYGLRGMEERAALMGAVLEIASTPDAGTTVAVRISNGVTQ